MGKGHSKLCRVFCFDRTLRTADGHADCLGKAAIFLAIRGLFVAHQIARIRTRQVQILLIICFCSFGQLTAILGVGTHDRYVTGVSIGNFDFLISFQINTASNSIQRYIIQNGCHMILNSNAIFSALNFYTGTINYCRSLIRIRVCSYSNRCSLNTPRYMNNSSLKLHHRISRIRSPKLNCI